MVRDKPKLRKASVGEPPSKGLQQHKPGSEEVEKCNIRTCLIVSKTGVARLRTETVQSTSSCFLLTEREENERFNEDTDLVEAIESSGVVGVDVFTSLGSDFVTCAGFLCLGSSISGLQKKM
jgi:hypothetical protein